MAETTAPAPPAKTPPKLNPVRVPIPEEPAAERTSDFREVLHAYSPEEAVLEAKRCIQCRRPWCVEACPITQDCREYIRLIAEGDFDGAARVTLRDDPLSSTLCKVCYHYCEDACVVKKKGVPIAIRHLKRAAMELGHSDLAYVPATPKGQRIAVVGGGPAGLMVAWELGIRGYAVTVFERERHFGGLMRTIPAYRMTGADEELDRGRFRDLDVTFRTDDRIGPGHSPEALLKEGYDAVFLGIGTPLHRTMGIPGEGLPGVFPALPLLRDMQAGRRPSLGGKVIVIGGGDVAMDAVRTARRLAGPDVTLVYRRTREEMPADPEEVHGAESEGVPFLFLRSPVRVEGSDHVTGLVVQRMELGPPDSGGRRTAVPVEGAQETLACDTLIVAVGQKADLQGFGPTLDLRLAGQGWPEGKGARFATATPGIYAAGGRSVVYAMGNAMSAAEAIDDFLASRRGAKAGPRPDPFGGAEPFKLPAGYTTPIRS